MNAKDRRLRANSAIVSSVTRLLENKVDKIKFKEGFKAADITTDKGTPLAYNKIFFRLMELMMLDVIEGNIVCFNKNTNACFYVHDWITHKELFEGKGIKEDRKIPLVDFKATGYKMPVVVFDPGYRDSELCKVFIPEYLYGMLIERVNEGKKYPKTVKKLWFEK